MAPQVLPIEGKTSYVSFWPSIASVSAQLRDPHPGRVRSGNPAVPGLASPGFSGRRRSGQSVKGGTR